MNTIPQNHTDATPQLNERLWQEWLLKGRESDRVGATKRLRIIQFVLLVGIISAAFQFVLK